MFKGGQSNPTYKLNTPAQSYVMRAKPGPVAKLLPSAHAIEREFAVMNGLQGTDVPVPACTACARTNPSLAVPST
jgi:aminoglycoside phosphotransferase (APT) family kinase protein